MVLMYGKIIKMKVYNCSEVFIDIVSKILFISGRGQAVSECLFVMNMINYGNLEVVSNNEWMVEDYENGES